MATDFKALGKNDQGALIFGVVAVILTFVGAYVSASSTVGGVKVGGENAWHGWSLFGSLLLLVALAVTIVRIFAPEQLPAGVPWNLVALAAAALGTVILIVKALTLGPPNGLAQADISSGPGWSGWILFVAATAFTVFTALSFRESGEKIPDLNTKNMPPAA